MNRRFLECVLPTTDGRFHYHLPSNLENKAIEAGTRLLVPFGRGLKVAFFIRRVQKPDVAATKAIQGLLDEKSLTAPKLFQLLLWISDYYITPLGALMKAALPQGIHAIPRRRFSLSDLGRENSDGETRTTQVEILKLLGEKAMCTEQALRKAIGGSRLSRSLLLLKKKGWIEERWQVDLPPVQAKIRQVAILKGLPAEEASRARALEKTAPRQALVLKRLIAAKGRLPFSDFKAAAERAAARRLLQKGFIAGMDEEISRTPGRGNDFPQKGEIVLNKDQAAAVKAIREALAKGAFAPFLLHGITGSGKTEVYLRAIEAVRDAGKGAILLLPEIGLTTHIASRFYERFGDRMALLHSGLSAGERYDEWRRIREGGVDVVIGARSAIFAPLRSLGAIIVDEEHDPSYRQEEGSRYNARDVALVRGRDEGAVVILGSATPSFESYTHSQTGKYTLLQLPDRIDARPLPKVHLVDLKEKALWVRPFFTKPLIEAIKTRLDANEQVLLFVNRRGFSPFLLCRDCGHAPACRYCSVSLTYHKKIHSLCCHYCGYKTATPTVCPECHGLEIQALGIGTEQVEEQIRALFPEARVARLDRDTVRKRGAQGKILSDMNTEETDILIGTQMIAKGHDFPKVTLVGVLSADLSLHVPDFRSSERTFQLLTQVAGRAGRGDRSGEVIFQTFHPENIAIAAAVTQDYSRFYKQAIQTRKESHYPPFSRLALILLKHRRETVLATEAAALADAIRKSSSAGTLGVLGPAPASRLRIKQWYRYHILLKGKDQQQIAKILRSAIDQWRQSGKRGAQIELKIDPQQFG